MNSRISPPRDKSVLVNAKATSPNAPRAGTPTQTVRSQGDIAIVARIDYLRTTLDYACHT